jgi:hypothetical protein
MNGPDIYAKSQMKRECKVNEKRLILFTPRAAVEISDTLPSCPEVHDHGLNPQAPNTSSKTTYQSKKKSAAKSDRLSFHLSLFN